MRRTRSSLETRTSPIAGSADASSCEAESGGLTGSIYDPGAEGGDPLRLRAQAEALADGDAGHPGDLAARRDDGQAAPQGAWDTGVGEDVLERLGAAEAEGTHPVALLPRTHTELVSEPVRVERRRVR